MPKISAAKFETRSDRARGIFRFEYPGGREGGGGRRGDNNDYSRVQAD